MARKFSEQDEQAIAETAAELHEKHGVDLEEAVAAAEQAFESERASVAPSGDTSQPITFAPPEQRGAAPVPISGRAGEPPPIPPSQQAAESAKTFERVLEPPLAPLLQKARQVAGTVGAGLARGAGEAAAGLGERLGAPEGLTNFLRAVGSKVAAGSTGLLGELPVQEQRAIAQTAERFPPGIREVLQAKPQEAIPAFMQNVQQAASKGPLEEAKAYGEPAMAALMPLEPARNVLAETLAPMLREPGRKPAPYDPEDIFRAGLAVGSAVGNLPLGGAALSKLPVRGAAEELLKRAFQVDLAKSAGEAMGEQVARTEEAPGSVPLAETTERAIVPLLMQKLFDSGRVPDRPAPSAAADKSRTVAELYRQQQAINAALEKAKQAGKTVNISDLDLETRALPPGREPETAKSQAEVEAKAAALRELLATPLPERYQVKPGTKKNRVSVTTTPVIPPPVDTTPPPVIYAEPATRLALPPGRRLPPEGGIELPRGEKPIAPPYINDPSRMLPEKGGPSVGVFEQPSTSKPQAEIEAKVQALRELLGLPISERYRIKSGTKPDRMSVTKTQVVPPIVYVGPEGKVTEPPPRQPEVLPPAPTPQSPPVLAAVRKPEAAESTAPIASKKETFVKRLKTRKQTGEQEQPKAAAPPPEESKQSDPTVPSVEAPKQESASKAEDEAAPQEVQQTIPEAPPKAEKIQDLTKQELFEAKIKDLDERKRFLEDKYKPSTDLDAIPVKKGTFEVSFVTGKDVTRKPVDGYIVGEYLGVKRAQIRRKGEWKDASFWDITHIPSGLALEINGSPTKDQAIEIARRLYGADIDWSRPTQIEGAAPNDRRLLEIHKIRKAQDEATEAVVHRDRGLSKIKNERETAEHENLVGSRDMSRIWGEWPDEIRTRIGSMRDFVTLRGHNITEHFAIHKPIKAEYPGLREEPKVGGRFDAAAVAAVMEHNKEKEAAKVFTPQRGNTWTLVHRQSGLAVPGEFSREHAALLAKLLESVPGVDWSITQGSRIGKQKNFKKVGELARQFSDKAKLSELREEVKKLEAAAPPAPIISKAKIVEFKRKAGLEEPKTTARGGLKPGEPVPENVGADKPKVSLSERAEQRIEQERRRAEWEQQYDTEGLRKAFPFKEWVEEKYGKPGSPGAEDTAASEDSPVKNEPIDTSPLTDRYTTEKVTRSEVTLPGEKTPKVFRGTEWAWKRFKKTGDTSALFEEQDGLDLPGHHGLVAPSLEAMKRYGDTYPEVLFPLEDAKHKSEIWADPYIRKHQEIKSGLSEKQWEQVRVFRRHYHDSVLAGRPLPKASLDPKVRTAVERLKNEVFDPIHREATEEGFLNEGQYIEHYFKQSYEKEGTDWLEYEPGVERMESATKHRKQPATSPGMLNDQDFVDWQYINEMARLIHMKRPLERAKAVMSYASETQRAALRPLVSTLVYGETLQARSKRQKYAEADMIASTLNGLMHAAFLGSPAVAATDALGLGTKANIVAAFTPFFGNVVAPTVNWTQTLMGKAWYGRLVHAEGRKALRSMPDFYEYARKQGYINDDYMREAAAKMLEAYPAPLITKHLERWGKAVGAARAALIPKLKIGRDKVAGYVVHAMANQAAQENWMRATAGIGSERVTMQVVEKHGGDPVAIARDLDIRKYASGEQTVMLQALLAGDYPEFARRKALADVSTPFFSYQIANQSNAVRTLGEKFTPGVANWLSAFSNFAGNLFLSYGRKMLGGTYWSKELKQLEMGARQMTPDDFANLEEGIVNGLKRRGLKRGAATTGLILSMMTAAWLLRKILRVDITENIKANPSILFFGYGPVGQIAGGFVEWMDAMDSGRSVEEEASRLEKVVERGVRLHVPRGIPPTTKPILRALHLMANAESKDKFVVYNLYSKLSGKDKKEFRAVFDIEKPSEILKWVSDVPVTDRRNRILYYQNLPQLYLESIGFRPSWKADMREIENWLRERKSIEVDEKKVHKKELNPFERIMLKKKEAKASVRDAAYDVMH